MRSGGACGGKCDFTGKQLSRTGNTSLQTAWRPTCRGPCPWLWHVWHNTTHAFGDGHLNRQHLAAPLRLFPQEENHEETEQSGECCSQRLRSPLRRWRPNAIGRQLAQWHFRTRLEERHQRTVLARQPTGRRPRPLPGCDGAIKPAACSCSCAACCSRSGPAPRARPPRSSCGSPQPAPRSCSCAPQPPAATKVTYAADAFFDFRQVSAQARRQGQAR
jgi:hypothetical protein